MKPLIVTSPYDGQTIGKLRLADAAMVEQALETAHAVYEDRNSWLPKQQRIEILERAAQLLVRDQEAFAHCITSEGGKPITDARTEVARAAGGLRAAARELQVQHGREVPMDLDAASHNRFAVTYHEPRGVVLAISAFNHPLNLIVHQLAPALAAGCPVIVKPALTTPLSCLRFATLLREAGLSANYCQVLLCENELAERLVRDPRIGFLSFIGSAAVGWKLRTLLPAGAACSLEHGGLAPTIIDETADWKRSIEPLLRGCFYHAGQVCVSGQRIYVHRAVAPSFVSAFVAQAAELRAGDPEDPDVVVGPLIAEREVDRVASWVDEAVSRGARLLCGGKRLSNTVYAPTVLEEVPQECTLMKREVFGPVVAISAFDHLDEAVDRANAAPGFFQAAVFTKDVNRALSLARRINGMAVMVNDHTAFRVDWMPFGGHRSSGLGVGGMKCALDEMSVERMIVFHAEGEPWCDMATTSHPTDPLSMPPAAGR